MRTTVTLNADVAAAVERMRKERGVGPSEAINELARLGMVEREGEKPFTQRTFDTGLIVDVSNVQDALDIAEGANRR